MHVRKTICLLTAAALAACMLTGCPWQEDPASSSSGTSSSSSGSSGTGGTDDSDAPSSSSSSSSQPETSATYTISVTTDGCACADADDGKITVQEGKTVTLTFTPTGEKTGLNGVKVNGQEVANIQKGSASYTHTFEKVQENQSIAVTFSDMGYTVTTDADKKTYNVHDETGLLAWAKAANTKLNTNCTLTDHIYLEEDWKQVGDLNSAYIGTFDGNGKTITGLNVADSWAAMFGAIGVGGKVQNLTLEDVDIDGSGIVGGIAVYNYGEIENCTVTGELTAGGANAVGGIVAHNYGTITGTTTGCRFEGTIINYKSSADPDIGGIAGRNGDKGKICGNCTCDYTYVIKIFNGDGTFNETEELRANLTGDDDY